MADRKPKVKKPDIPKQVGTGLIKKTGRMPLLKGRTVARFAVSKPTTRHAARIAAIKKALGR